jgi:leader peptidase (prepilin peptidase)/N-methyltransferase
VHTPYTQRRVNLISIFPLSRLRQQDKSQGSGSTVKLSLAESPVPLLRQQYPQQPFIELLTGLIFMAAYLRFGISPMLIKALFLISVLLVISCIDLKHYIIPDKIIIFALSGGAVLVILFHDPAIESALAGSVSSALFLLVLALISHGGMGGGDIKLAAVIGLCLGWPSGLFAVILGCLLAGLSGLALVLTRVKSRKDAIPFAPFLSAGTLLMLNNGSDIMYWYFCNALFI